MTGEREALGGESGAVHRCMETADCCIACFLPWPCPDAPCACGWDKPLGPTCPDCGRPTWPRQSPPGGDSVTASETPSLSETLAAVLAEHWSYDPTKDYDGWLCECGAWIMGRDGDTDAAMQTHVAATLAAHVEAAEAEAVARDALRRVVALGDSWVGFDSTHHFGDALLNAIGPTALRAAAQERDTRREVES